MTEHDAPDEEIFDRLRAADPAVGSQPDLTRLRAAVDARIAAPPAAGNVTPLAPARARRVTWLRMAAVAAAALVVATAGFGLGRSTGGPAPTAAPAAAPAISLGGPGGAGTGAPEALVDRADAAIYPAPAVSHMSFHAVGLSDEATTFRAWTYDPSASFSAERTAALGAALGLKGEPKQEGGAWQLGVTDGSGAYLTVSPDGTTTANFYDPAKDPHQCLRTGPGGTTTPAEPGGGSAPSEPGATNPEGTTESGAAPYEWCDNPDAAPAPQGEDAFAPVRSLLTAAGYDPATFELVENDYGDPSMTEVVAHQLVDGQRTGSAWYVTVTGAGVQSFNGMLAPLSELGDYPVISPADAVDRLGDPRFGSFADVRILSPATGHVLDAPASVPEGTSADAPAASSQGPDATSPAGPPPAATPGSPVPWPVEEVAITGARLGPALYTTPSGTALLVPAYELSADDGRTWSVIAVAEEALNLAR